MIMNLLKIYDRAGSEILEKFNYEMQYRQFAIVDMTDWYWAYGIQSDFVADCQFLWDSDRESLKKYIDSGEYGLNLYDGRLYNDKMYVVDDYTMVTLDTQADNSIFLAILDNNKRVVDK